MTELKRFAECESSVFISYSHDDDKLNNGWISHFAAELKCDLTAALAREDKGRDEMPQVYLSKYTGPVAGNLGPELRDKVLRSFAMVIVVGEKYVSSDWCLKELGYFHEAFGHAGLDSRLTIVALRERPMRLVTEKPQWQTWFKGRNPVWRSFFDPNDLNSDPVPVLRDDTPGMTNAMFKLYKPLRDDLVAKIRADLDKATPPTAATRWVMGACRPELDACVQALADKLAELKPEVDLVPLEALRSSKSLKALLASAEALVLPFNQGQPINDDKPGGHLAQQLAVWRSLGKRDDAVRLLDLDEVATDELAEPDHLRFLQDCELEKLKPDQVLDWLAPPPLPLPPVAGSVNAPRRPSRRVCVFIENNALEHEASKQLGAQIRERWDRLLLARQVDGQLSLRIYGFDIDKIDDFPLDEADGVVLLWGQKEPRSLLCQINRVEDIFREPAPAIVAHLSPPQPRSQQRMPAMQWDVLRFCGRDLPPVVLEPETDDNGSLDSFVQDVLGNTLRRHSALGQP